jgi:hypothetical protein
MEKESVKRRPLQVLSRSKASVDETNLRLLSLKPSRFVPTYFASYT